jgi:CubicO group peptidase (beta-lactamase class C family)
VQTHADDLDILSLQRALNHQPGAQSSYTNSGYNLLAIIVSRVSGQSFAQFSRARIFEPLGMRNTQWRDDFRRVIKGRAQAYSTSEGRWYLDMPFENIYGNGGLLTTVDDLLTWTAALEKPTRLWKAVVDSLHVRGRLNNGDTFPYALGLATNEYRGVSWVGHDGATAGYATGLIRFPGKGLAIAVLCNASTASGIDIAFTLADSLLASSLGPPTAPSSDHPASVDSLVWKPNAEELAAFAGTYYSPDVETALNVSVVRDSLVLFRRAARRVVLAPVKSQTFTGFRDRVWFTRDSAGRVVALHVGTSRAFDVVFERR